MKILITGAAGEIGSRLANAFRARGHLVRALVLPGDAFVSRLGEGVEICYGDVTKPDTLGEAFAGVEVVYHLAAVLLCEKPELFQAVNTQGTRNVVAAAVAAKIGHLIHVSSASVVYPRTTHYSRSKRLAEAAVTSCPQINWTVVRPTLVYDREGGLEFKLYADFVKRYPVVPLVAGGRARKRPVHVDDLLTGLLAMAGNSLTFGRFYNLSGGETVTLRELAELMLERQGLRKPMVSLPASLCLIGSAIWGRLKHRPLLMEHTLAGLTQDADLDPAQAICDLGYMPIGVREGLRR